MGGQQYRMGMGGQQYGMGMGAAVWDGDGRAAV